MRGTYSTSGSDAQKPRPGIHPVWRGIGCLLVIIIPLMSYAGASLLLDANASQGWITIPREVSAPLAIAPLGPIPAIYEELFFAKLLVGVFVALVIFGLFTVLYSIVYRAGGGLKPSPLDAPPPRRKARKSR